MNQALAIRVIHCAVPGRVRLHVPPMKRCPWMAERFRCRLLQLEGIRSAEASAVTGNLLIQFDPARQTLASIARQIGQSLKDLPLLTVAGKGRADQPTRDTSVEPAPDGGTERRAGNGSYWWAACASTREVLQKLAVADLNGLSEAEARRRLTASPPELARHDARRRAGEMIREQLFSVPTAMLGGAMVVSYFTSGPFHAAAIGGVVVLNAAIGYLTERHAENALETLRRLAYPRAHVIRSGQTRTVPATELVRGDVIELGSGDFIPADARIIQGTLLVDEAILTGESDAVHKHGKSTELPGQVHEFENLLFQGTSAVDGRARAVVLATGRATELGQIQALVDKTSPPRTQLQRQLDDLGKTLGMGAGGICGALLAAGVLRGQPWLETLQTVVSLAVSAVPEGLPAIATTAQATGMERMRRREVIIRKLSAVEALGSVTVLCVDKTGTLTLNRMRVSQYCSDGGVFRYVEGHDPSKAQFLLNGRPVNPASHQALDAMLQIGVLCSDAQLRREKDGLRVSGSATEGALLFAGNAGGYWPDSLREVFPLRVMHRRDETYLRMASVHRHQEGGILVAVKGSLEAVLELCSSRLDAVGDSQPMTDQDRAGYRIVNERMAEDGLRVLAFAQARSEQDGLHGGHLENLTWLGLVGLEDPIRPGVAEAIQRCHQAGMRTVILTGDQRGTAQSVARRLLLDGAGDVLDTGELRRLSAEELVQTVRSTGVFARVSPEDKLRIVEVLQAAGEVVAMTGDGVNDGPALKAADVGIAMGLGSTDVARELADVVLTRNDFAPLVSAVEQGRTIFANIRRVVSYMVRSNVAELTLAGITLICRIPFPFRPIQILWLHLVSDVFPSLALVLEPTDRRTMREPPRPPGAPIIGAREWRRLAVDAGIAAASVLAAYLWAARRYGFGPFASAVAFTALTLGEVFYAVVCRGTPEKRPGPSRVGWGQHGPLWASVVGGVGLQLAVNHWKPLRRLLGGAPLGILDYGVALAAAIVPTLSAAARGLPDVAARPG